MANNEDVAELISHLSPETGDTAIVGTDADPSAQKTAIFGHIASLHNPIAMNRMAEAADKLHQMGPAAVPALIAALKSPVMFGRNNAVMLLGDIGDTRAVEPLCAALKNDSNGMVRSMAALALGKIGDARAVPALIEALTEKRHDPMILAQKEGKTVFDKLRIMKTVIDGGFMGAESSAAEALGRIKDARAVVPLIALLENGGFLEQSAAAEALGEIGDAQAIAPLEALLERIPEADAPRPGRAFSRRARDAAQKALGKFRAL